MKTTREQSAFLSQRDVSLAKDGYYVALHIEEENTAYFMHYHDYYEVVFYFGNDTVTYIQNGTHYTVGKGDVVLCGMFTEHMFLCENNRDFERFAIGIDFELLASLSRDEASLIQIFNQSSSSYPVFHTNYHQMGKYLRIIEDYENTNETNGGKVVKRALISLLLANLYVDCSGQDVPDNINLRHVQLVSEIVHYIEEHMQEWISLEQLAKAINYSVAHTTKTFKEITGETISQYILKRRIAHAKLCISRGLTITESAEQSGFANYNYFFRAFKKLEGIGPRDYQKNLQKA